MHPPNSRNLWQLTPAELSQIAFVRLSYTSVRLWYNTVMLSSRVQQVNQLGSFFEQMAQDAARYPPGSPSMDRAIADHIFMENAAKERIVGPFLYPVDRFREMSNQFPSYGECGIARLGSDLSGLDKTYLTAVEEERLSVTHIELASLDEDSDEFGAIGYISRCFPYSVVFMEVPRLVDLGFIFGHTQGTVRIVEQPNS